MVVMNDQNPDLPDRLLGHVDFRYHNGVDQGWWPLLEEMHERLARIDPDYRLSQVKQKFGLLTVYVDDEHYRDRPEMMQALETTYREFRRRSAETCENCGAVGQWRNDPPAPFPPRPHNTVCDECSKRNE
jgi:hypothetical protein